MTIRILALLEAATVTGPAKNLIDFARFSREQGTLVSIASFVRPGAPTECAEAVRAAGVPLIPIPESGSLDRSVLARLREAIGAERPDIVQTHAIKSHFLVFLSRVWRRMPWVAFHHGYTTTDTKMLLYNQLDRVSLRFPRRLVTVSEAFARQLTARGVDRRRITVLHNAVDPQWTARVRSLGRTEARGLLGLPREGTLLLAAGRMSAEKGHNDLIAAFHRLRARHAEARLVLVGDGPERPRLEEAARGAAIFTGQVRDVAPFYAAADILVLPSLTEGSPNVLLEAMAAGLPVVATAVGGVPEIAVDEENALLVPPRKPEAMAAAVERLMRDPRLARRLADAGTATIGANHLPAARARKLADMYQEILR